MQRGFVGILVLLVVVIAASVGGYFVYNNLQENARTQKEINESLKAGQVSPSPSPTPDETANWKTYSKFGYQIKYPESGNVTEFSIDPSLPNHLSSVRIDITSNQTEVSYWINVWKNLGVNITDSTSRDKWCSLIQKELIGQEECNWGGNLPAVQINGYKAYQVSGGLSASLVKMIYIPQGSYVYELTIPAEDPSGNKLTISDQILSTFKFAE